MAALKGTILASKIVPTDSLDTYATHDDTYGRGGHRSVDTIVERDEISPERRKEGMTVYVKENKTKYILENGVENTNWKVDSCSGGSGGDVDLTDYYTKEETDTLVDTKQDTLVSATNIKTINGESILGSGDLVISGGGAVDLSEYYKKTETYNKIEVDTIISNIPETDLTNYYNKTQVDSLIDAIPEADLTNYYNKTQVDAIALDKVDKVAGKQLSTEDYTTADKNKLTGLSNYTKPASEPISYITGLQTALDSKVNKNGVEALHSTDALRISGTTLSLYKGDGTFESVVTQDTVYTLPTASATVLGGIKVGTNLSIDANGVLSANDTNVSFSEISGKPTNISGYGITDAYTKTEIGAINTDYVAVFNAALV